MRKQRLISDPLPIIAALLDQHVGRAGQSVVLPSSVTGFVRYVERSNKP